MVVTTILRTLASSPTSTFLRRSCVIGRGVTTFSISSAMALASYTPTQIGRIPLPQASFRITMGMFVIGSIIRPRIFISTSTGSSLCNYFTAMYILSRTKCKVRNRFHPLAALSNSFTCFRAASVTRDPLIIRASSSTRASPVKPPTRVTDLPSSTSFSIRY